MFFWILLGLGATTFSVGLGRWVRAEVRRPGRKLPSGLPAHGLALATLLPVAWLSVYPYVGGNLVGAGDSYHYGLQVADFVTQARHGVMPVLAGQSDYAFNGNIHTLRTAPYFTHLAGLLDLLTARRQSFVALQNLTVVTTAVLAVWAAFLAAFHASGGRRMAAWLLAAIYGLSPAIMGPLALNDMFATYMAAPWLVLCWYGLAEILRPGHDARAQFIAAGALGLVWYAHPPVAAWLTLAWGLMQFARTVRAGGEGAQWIRQLAAGLFLLGLTAGIFVSVATLGPGPQAPAYQPTYDVGALQRFLHAGFTPFSAGHGAPGIQLGYGLWLLLLLTGLIGLRRRATAVLILLAVLAVFLPYLIQMPVFSDAFWRLLPEQLANLSNWPEQRLCPVLAAGIVVAFATALRATDPLPAAGYRMVCAFLTVAALWSAAEVVAIHRRPGVARLPPAVQEIQFSPQNLRLTRYSYALFARTPAYFTNGWMDPEFESRLLDEKLDPLTDNAAAIIAAAGTSPFAAINGGRGQTLNGPGDQLFEFAFADAANTGEISIQGDGLERFYTLPLSGGARAFGSAPGAAKTIRLHLARPGPQQITIKANMAGVSVRTIPFHRDDLPVRVDGLLPYAARVRAPAPGFLETPRAFIDGYAATVNDRPAPVRPSPQGLVMVPVPAGESRVELAYPGPAVLRAAWVLSLACLAAWPWLISAAPGSNAARPAPLRLDQGFRTLWPRHGRRIALILLSLGLLAATGLGLHRFWQHRQAYGSLRLVLEIPKSPVNRAEPLLTLGRPGAADCIYLIYEDPAHIRFGLDHWGHDGLISAPLAVDFGRNHVVEITIGGLYPARSWFGRFTAPTEIKSGTGLFQVRLDGRVVFSQEQPFYAVAPDEVVLGRNPVGSSVAGVRFSGRILSAERFIAPGH